jgi:ribosome biogenesis GTPase / thiamine phosphate phosphatase
MTARDATVIATYSRRMRVRFDDSFNENQEVNARIKGKKLKPVCGDKVVVESIDGEADWLIISIHERRNELNRPNSRGNVETLAANLDLVVVVAAASPKPDWFIVDRYLCAAENMHAAGAVVYNKTDLAKANDAEQMLRTYEQLDYPSIACSAELDHNLEPLAELLTDNTAIIVGQSGVGKSSLINRLSTVSAQKTATISTKSGEGRHTTVNSAMISLPQGGVVIDSPGVRDYAPALQSSDQAIAGFREVRELGENCRFANCKHLREPNCAVKQAVESGDMDERRYESYRRTLALTERINRDRY